MSRREGALVAVLLVITALALWFAPPERLSATPSSLATEGAGASVDASPTATLVAPTLTSTPQPPTPTASVTPTLTPSATPTAAAPTPTPYPFPVRTDLARYLYVDQASQALFVFEQGQLLRAIPCSTGLPEDDKYTPAWSGSVGHFVGTFFAFDVFADDAWYLYQSAGAILIHSLPYTWRNGYKVYEDREALGVRPASHGCIRIAPEHAAWLSAWNPEGVVITVSDPYLERWR